MLDLWTNSRMVGIIRRCSEELFIDPQTKSQTFGLNASEHVWIIYVGVIGSCGLLIYSHILCFVMFLFEYELLKTDVSSEFYEGLRLTHVPVA